MHKTQARLYAQKTVRGIEYCKTYPFASHDFSGNKKRPPHGGRRAYPVLPLPFAIFSQRQPQQVLRTLPAITGGPVAALAFASVRLSEAMFPTATRAPLSASGDSL